MKTSKKRNLRAVANIIGWGTNLFFYPRTPLGKLFEVGCFVVPLVAMHFVDFKDALLPQVFIALLLGLCYVTLGASYHGLNSQGGLGWPTLGNKVKTCIFSSFSGALLGLSSKAFGYSAPMIFYALSLAFSAFANVVAPINNEDLAQMGDEDDDEYY